MKNKTVYVCQSCGYESPKWLGKCPDCGGWNTFCEETVAKESAGGARVLSSTPPMGLSEITGQDETRIKTQMNELDQVLGGGLVKGSLVLVGGEPGIGKSTLLLQICESLGKVGKVLYVSGEESPRQIKLRANRLGITSENLLLMSETNLAAIVSQIQEMKPLVVIVDSIQTIFNDSSTSAPGSVTQVRDATMHFMRIAKETGIAFFIVGHVTKEGAIAGPRVLEHMVDCVLYFEGDRHQSYRILRGVKNRYGSTNEIGVFEMADRGLVEVENPSASMLRGRPDGASGSAVVCMMEGTRPILAEIQSLVSPTGFGIPRRMATGVDYNRMVLLIAVIEKRLKLSLQNQDAYVNVAGGIKATETAADLAMVAAIISSLQNKIISQEMVFFGEVGLTGEIRAVSNAEKRVAEVKKLGFHKCVIPFENQANLKSAPDFEIVPLKNISELSKLI